MNMKKIGSIMVSLLSLAAINLYGEIPSQQQPQPSSVINRCEIAIQRLKQGNVRFQTDTKTLCYDVNAMRRKEIIEQQHPFAVVLSCSDSRAAPEIIFDQGLGDIFVVRVAGNVVGSTELDSIEYGIFHLGACIVVVLGHENCGAVQAVLQGATKDIPSVAALVEPGVQLARKEKGELTLERAVKANVQMNVRKLRENAAIKSLIDQKKLQVVGAYYHFGSGEVEFL